MKQKGALTIAVFIILLLVIVSMRDKDSYRGFYYPDASNLLEYTDSIQGFSSFAECLNWVEQQRDIMNRDRANLDDYECGLNCKYDADLDIQVCEDTLDEASVYYE